MSIEKTEIQQRIAELEKEREKFRIEANQQIAAYNGAINELRKLVKEPEAEKNKVISQSGSASMKTGSPENGENR